jgi:hypothetical protein
LFQVVASADEHKFDFDLLDDTKVIPEEDVPIAWVGRMVLNKNPTEFFPEVEQVRGWRPFRHLLTCSVCRHAGGVLHAKPGTRHRRERRSGAAGSKLFVSRHAVDTLGWAQLSRFVLFFFGTERCVKLTV